jgi:hypothetical protein
MSSLGGNGGVKIDCLEDVTEVQGAEKRVQFLAQFLPQVTVPSPLCQ